MFPEKAAKKRESPRDETQHEAKNLRRARKHPTEASSARRKLRELAVS